MQQFEYRAASTVSSSGALMNRAVLGASYSVDSIGFILQVVQVVVVTSQWVG